MESKVLDSIFREMREEPFLKGTERLTTIIITFFEWWGNVVLNIFSLSSFFEKEKKFKKTVKNHF